MKEKLAALVRKWVSPSMRYELRSMAHRLHGLMEQAWLGRWEITRFRLQHESPYEVLYVGRKNRRDMAKLLIGGKSLIDHGVQADQAQPVASQHVVVISEVPTAGALNVPVYLSAVVPLGRSLEDITARYDSELRRSIRKNRPHYQMRQALLDEDIERADRDMLRPYAVARQGTHAAQFDTREVFRIARTTGRLDLIELNGEVVACHLGCVITRNGKRYWSTLRFGYTEAVFSDAKKLREVNSMTTYLALEWAIAHGFDYYDIGLCVARPDDGLLKWKRRRGGDVDSLGNDAYLFIRLPKTGAARVLWDTPLFAFEGKALTLHLGLPDGQSGEEAARRYHEMVFGGVDRIYLHCAEKSGEQFLETLRSRYAGLQATPILQMVTST